MSEGGREVSIMWWPWPTRVCCVMKKFLFDVCFYIIVEEQFCTLKLEARML